MLANRSRDTKPELNVRRLLHGAGYRFRVCYRPIPTLRRTADIVFTRHRLAVFIDGCFWHGCPVHGQIETVRHAEYWRDKFVANRSRDAETNRVLAEAGWAVLRFWEHETPAEIAQAVMQALPPRFLRPGDKTGSS